MEIQSSQFTQISENFDSNKMEESVQDNSPTMVEMQDWLISYLSELLEIEPAEVDVTVPFDRYGLDSSAAIGMTSALEEWLGYELDPTLIYDYPTIEALVTNLLKEGGTKV